MAGRLSQPYEDGANTEWFQTGRTDGPPLRHDDPFVEMNVVYRYLFDLAKGELAIHEIDHEGPVKWPVIQRVRFVGSRGCEFSPRPTKPLDWRNRRQSYGSDDPKDTARAIVERICAVCPIAGGNASVDVRGDFEIGPGGLSVRLVVAWDEAQQGTGPDDSIFGDETRPGRVTDLFEDPSCRLFPARQLADADGCMTFLGVALDTLTESIAAGAVPGLSVEFFDRVFANELLDLAIDQATLENAVRESVRSALRTAAPRQ